MRSAASGVAWTASLAFEATIEGVRPGSERSGRYGEPDVFPACASRRSWIGRTPSQSVSSTPR